MAQPYMHTLSRCPKCGAGQEEPCLTAYGAVAEKVHYGRPQWSRRTRTWREIDRARGTDLAWWPEHDPPWERYHEIC